MAGVNFTQLLDLLRIRRARGLRVWLWILSDGTEWNDAACWLRRQRVGFVAVKATRGEWYVLAERTFGSGRVQDVTSLAPDHLAAMRKDFGAEALHVGGSWVTSPTGTGRSRSA